MMNINIKNNNTIWGIFNENHNDINDNVPLSEEEGIKNFETMPNTEGMGEKFLNNNDNKILNNNKINNNNNNNKINNNKIQSKNPNTFSNVSSFAVVNEIKNVDTTNQIHHLNNKLLNNGVQSLSAFLLKKSKIAVSIAILSFSKAIYYSTERFIFQSFLATFFTF